MRIIRLNDLVEVRWKNGGGVTREIASAQHGQGLLWRLSMADVAVNGPFSDFAGLMRILTVIEGDAMALETPEGVLMARPGVPVRFDGGLKATSRLTTGPLRDLNLIFDPAKAEGGVIALHGPLETILEADASLLCALHGLAEGIGLGPAVLGRGDTALLDTESLPLRLPAGAAALLITLDLHQG